MATDVSPDSPCQDNKPVAKKSMNKTQKILIIGIILLLVTVAIVGIVLYNLLKKEPDNTAAGNSNLIVDESNLDTIEDSLAEKVADGMYEVSMNTVWHFENGNEPSKDAYVANVNSNTKSIYFEIILNGTDEPIYTSSVIPVGSALKEMKLDIPLEKGIYDASCTYHLLAEDMSETSSLSVTVTINVEN